MGDRILGAFCVVIASAMGWSARAYSADISYEPVGPRAFPLLLAVLLGLLGLWLLLAPKHVSSAGGTPVLATTSTTTWRAIGLCAVSVLVYGALFQTLGFVVATVLMSVPVGMAFGGSLRACLLGGAGLGISLFFLFDRVLDVILPTGLLSFVLGGR
ncbi:MAG: tripartite tricarboxylate transporter TctB family protein [Burkholderiaceae bacterium]|nr:tripartite tricarboxylate transporter TctB family protein [Burkholderiaceae bacterium]